MKRTRHDGCSNPATERHLAPGDGSGHGCGLGSQVVVLVLGLTLLLVSGCATKRPFQEVSYEAWALKRYESVLTSRQPSQYSDLFLRGHELVDSFRSDPVAVLTGLDQALCPDATRAELFVLSELAYLAATQAKTGSEKARTLYASAARYAYACLFDEAVGPMLSIYDPRFGIAVDLYNHALAALFEHRSGDWMANVEEQQRIPLVRGFMTLSLDDASVVALDQIRDASAVYRVEVTTLDQHWTRQGIGIPVMAVRDVEPRSNEDADTIGLLRTARAFPATGLLRFPDSVCDGDIEVDGARAVLESYDSVLTSHVTLGSQDVPLEADFSVPLAFLLMQGSEIAGTGVSGMYRKLHSEVIGENRGLVLLRPYQPGKIPVVFVHGLMSSPLTWLPLINNLLADPDITERYQFAFFFYPTGNPILYSAAELRSVLERYRRKHDPEGTDRAMNHMVLIGHSMGGLLSRLMMAESQGAFVETVVGRSMAELDMTKGQRESLQRFDFFEPLPLGRVLFLATPHRGANMASGLVGRLGERVTLFPGYVWEELSRAAEGLAIDIGEVPGGIKNLAYGSDFMTALESLTMDPDVPYHLIIGNKKAANTPGGTDGVVKYDSSHIDGAASEKIVKSGHSVQITPPTALEVRRILLQHLEELDE